MTRLPTSSMTMDRQEVRPRSRIVEFEVVSWSSHERKYRTGSREHTGGSGTQLTGDEGGQNTGDFFFF